jgi:hypothetical protein
VATATDVRVKTAAAPAATTLKARSGTKVSIATAATLATRKTARERMSSRVVALPGS